MSFKYYWCWECNQPSVDLGKSNTCCCKFDSSHEEQLEAWNWSKTNEPPIAPTPEEIDNQLILFHSELEKLIIVTFEGYSYGKWYWLPKQWADKIGHTIPTYEELCEKYNLTPTYDCKTGKQWQVDESKDVYSKLGWSSEESFEKEEIPYREFCRRVRISKIKHNTRTKYDFAN